MGTLRFAAALLLAGGLGLKTGAVGAETAEPGPGPYHTSGLLRGGLVEDRPLPIYAPDPLDLWNRIHHLLFTSAVQACVSRYYESPRAAAAPPNLGAASDEGARLRAINDYYDRRFAVGCTKVIRLEGGDLPEFFFGGRSAFLLEEPRFGRVVGALEAFLAAPLPRDRGVEARVLFQQDLWNRFDALRPAGRAPQGRAARLAELLGRAIARLAPGEDALRQIRPNFPEVVRAYPQAGADLFAAATPWRELVPSFRGSDRTTAHAATVGHRRVFRVFLRIPEAAGGVPCLEAHLRGWPPSGPDPCPRWGHGIPHGSRAVLMESLLALSPAGEIVPVPIVLNIQIRDVRLPQPGPDGRLELENVPVQVLHGSRRDLAAAQRPAGGLEPLPPDTPVPAGFAAFGRPPESALAPVAIVCRTCHELDGSHLMVRAFHNLEAIHVLEPQNTVVQDRVIRAKRLSPDYQALKRFFDSR